MGLEDKVPDSRPLMDWSNSHPPCNPLTEVSISLCLLCRLIDKNLTDEETKQLVQDALTWLEKNHK
jgi:hypothetical protein